MTSECINFIQMVLLWLVCYPAIGFKTPWSPVSSVDMSSEDWLQVHGLVAKKLTIMDALSPTTVPHSPTYVPILDKHVVSKVFDEVSKLSRCPNF